MEDPQGAKTNSSSPQRAVEHLNSGGPGKHHPQVAHEGARLGVHVAAPAAAAAAAAAAPAAGRPWAAPAGGRAGPRGRGPALLHAQRPAGVVVRAHLVGPGKGGMRRVLLLGREGWGGVGWGGLGRAVKTGRSKWAVGRQVGAGGACISSGHHWHASFQPPHTVQGHSCAAAPQPPPYDPPAPGHAPQT